MKFILKRASQWGVPVDIGVPGAKLETFTLVERKAVDWPDPEWFMHGANHREENGQQLRDKGPVRLWTIEIDGLEALAQFSKEQGWPVIVSPHDTGVLESTPELTIYDGYLE